MSAAEPTISTFSVTKGGKVEETYAAFQSWDLNRTLDQNLERMREENPIHAATDAWLKEMRRIFRVRFGSIELHAPLIRLAQGGLPMDRWRPILLWHLCFRELLISDFIENWLFPRKQDGFRHVRSDDVREYLRGLPDRGLVDSDWTPNTVNRMASGIPTYCADFNLLQGGSAKEIAPFHVPDDALLYALYSIRAGSASGAKILGDVRWRRFLLSRPELEQSFLRLHQHGQVNLQMAGSLVTLDLPHEGIDGYVEHLVG